MNEFSQIWTEDKLNHLVNIAKNIINTNKPPAKLKQQLKVEKTLLCKVIK